MEAAERADAVPLAEAWNAYRKTRFEKNEAGPKDAVMLDKARGAWAANPQPRPGAADALGWRRVTDPGSTSTPEAG